MNLIVAFAIGATVQTDSHGDLKDHLWSSSQRHLVAGL